jgi:hypothetical protein
MPREIISKRIAIQVCGHLLATTLFISVGNVNIKNAFGSAVKIIAENPIEILFRNAYPSANCAFVGDSIGSRSWRSSRASSDEGRDEENSEGEWFHD